MVWNRSIIAVALLFIVFRKNKAFGNESKTIGKKAERSNDMSKLINSLVGNIVSSGLIYSGVLQEKQKYPVRFCDADDEWLKICYTEKRQTGS